MLFTRLDTRPLNNIPAVGCSSCSIARCRINKGCGLYNYDREKEGVIKIVSLGNSYFNAMNTEEDKLLNMLSFKMKTTNSNNESLVKPIDPFLKVKVETTLQNRDMTRKVEIT